MPHISPAAPAVHPRTADRLAPIGLAVAAGLVTGALTSVGQTVLGDTVFQGVANAVSPWLVAPFLVGAFTRRTVLAAFVGMLTCAAQVAGYYLVADLRGFAVGSASILLWTVAGVVGGPLFGVAGRLWRDGRAVGGRWDGLGGALVVACWFAEALVTYLVVLRRPEEAAVFAVGAGLSFLLLARGGRRRAVLTRLPLCVALGCAGFAVLHLVV